MLNFLYIAVSWVLLRWHDLFTLMGLSQQSGIGWALSIIFLVDHRPVAAVPPVRQAGALPAQHAADAAEDAEGPREVQERPGRDEPADDGPAAGGGLQPADRLPADVPADPGVPRPVPRAAAPVELGRHLCQEPGSHPQQRPAPSTRSARRETCTPRRPRSSARRWPRRSTTRVDHHAHWAAIRPRRRIVAGHPAGHQRRRRPSGPSSGAGNATTTPEGTAATIQRLMIWLIPVGVLASGSAVQLPARRAALLVHEQPVDPGPAGVHHPTTTRTVEEPAKPVGELGKTLAPRPGQRPVRLPKGKPVAEQLEPSTGAEDDGEAGADRPDAGAPRSQRPAPGQRPNRPSGKRPPAKRPTQAKKRR